MYEGEVVAFACLWFDKANKCAVLEPVGTHKRHIKKGLAKALIYEGMNRIKALGANRIYVYAELPFYLAIGFNPVADWPVFGKNYEDNK
jgi:predicted N-acetyltransferase YhbS